MSNDRDMLKACWRLRNAATEALALAEDQMRRAVNAADVAQLVAFIETFSPTLSAGTEWTRTFEPLVERLWAWRDDATMAALAETFRERGMPWVAVTHALSPDHGAQVRAVAPQPALTRVPALPPV